MKSAWASSIALLLALVHAQERCDAPYPNVYCNTTDIMQYESSDCRPYHVFVTRGSDEPYPGRLGNLTKQICEEFGQGNCGFESVQYPAKSTAWGKDEWCKSAAKGAANGQSQMKTYSGKCPDSKLILLGFSQGAAVAQDILGGGGGHVFECDQAISPALDASTAPGSNIVAAVTFGAVIRSRGQNFTVGQGADQFDGKRARTEEQLKGLNQYSSVLRDYCHVGDPMCAVGSKPEDVYVHLNYFEEHNQEVVTWVAGKAKSSAKVSDGTITESSSTGSSASSTQRPATSTSGTQSDDSKTQSSQSKTTNSNDQSASSSLLAAGRDASIVAMFTVALLGYVL